MRARIHRGAREIGGNCVEIEAGAERIVLDIGLPLEQNDDHGEHPVLPTVSGLAPPSGG
jgi:ribonuclease J